MPNWREDAECASGRHDTDLWFPKEGDHQSAKLAKSVCDVLCPVRDQCREFAVTFPVPLNGVWGGLSKKQVRDQRLSRGIAAVSESSYSGLPVENAKRETKEAASGDPSTDSSG